MAYLVTTLLLLFAGVWRPGRGPGPLARFAPALIVVILVSGLLVELLQTILTARRQAEFADWVADAAGDPRRRNHPRAGATRCLRALTSRIAWHFAQRATVDAYVIGVRRSGDIDVFVEGSLAELSATGRRRAADARRRSRRSRKADRRVPSARRSPTFEHPGPARWSRPRSRPSASRCRRARPRAPRSNPFGHVPSAPSSLACGSWRPEN